MVATLDEQLRQPHLWTLDSLDEEQVCQQSMALGKELLSP